jgi:hypothetical protein
LSARVIAERDDEEAIIFRDIENSYAAPRWMRAEGVADDIDKDPSAGIAVDVSMANDGSFGETPAVYATRAI